MTGKQPPLLSTFAPVEEVAVKRYWLRHLTDGALLRDLKSLVTQDRATTAAMLAHLGEVESRKLYVPAGYSSMHVYCVQELRFSDDVAYKRIRAGRTARRFPTIYLAVADGRLHLSAIVLLATHLNESNALELLTAAEGRSKAEIEKLLAEKFPQDDLPFRMAPVASNAAVHVIGMPASELAQEPFGETSDTGTVPELSGKLAPGPIEEQASRHMEIQAAVRPVAPSAPQPRVTPIAPDRVALQLTVSQGTADKLQYAQGLLGFRIQHGDISEVLDRALDALIAQLEKSKFAATRNPRAARRRTSSSERYMPSHMKRQVEFMANKRTEAKTARGKIAEAGKATIALSREPDSRARETAISHRETSPSPGAP